MMTPERILTHTIERRMGTFRLRFFRVFSLFTLHVGFSFPVLFRRGHDEGVTVIYVCDLGGDVNAVYVEDLLRDCASHVEEIA